MHELAPATSTALTTVSTAPLLGFPQSAGRYAIPQDDMGAFRDLKQKERERVLMLLAAFEQMDTDPAGLVAAADRLAFTLRHVRGFSSENLQRLHREWRACGWQALRRGYTNGKAKLPPEFVQYVRALMEQNPRSMKQAINLLRRQWISGVSIPGYGTWRDWFFANFPDQEAPAFIDRYPEGWSDSTLYAIQPKKAARALATRGFAAMRAHLPSMIRDTSGLLPLQLITIDDFEIDHLCVFNDPATGPHLCKVSGIAAMDVATRKVIGLLMKPRLPKANGAEQSITRAEVRLVLFEILRGYGVPAHGMTILCENAAAAVTNELKTTFSNLFGGRVAVTRTGMIADKAFSNGFIERGGKPQQKGWIESLFNLAWNVAATFPGYKGRNYIEKPGTLEEKQRQTLQLINSGPRDPIAAIERLKQYAVPFDSADVLIEKYNAVFDLVELRTDHAMIGFDDVVEWRRPDDGAGIWRPLSEIGQLTEAEQLRCELRRRKQSPRERWNALMPQVHCQAVDPAALMMLCLTPKKAKLKSQKLTFDHAGKPYTFAEHGSPVLNVPEGTELLVYFDPCDAASAHVCHVDGRYIGEIKRLGPVDISDQDAINGAERDLAAIFNGLREEVRSRPLHQATDAQLALDAARNAEAAKQELALTAALNRPLPNGGQPETALGMQTARSMAAAADKKHAQRLQEVASRRAIAQAAAQLSPEDIAAATGAAPSADEAPQFSADEITDLLSDDPQ